MGYKHQYRLGIEGNDRFLYLEHHIEQIKAMDGFGTAKFNELIDHWAGVEALIDYSIRYKDVLFKLSIMSEDYDFYCWFFKDGKYCEIKGEVTYPAFTIDMLKG